MSSRLDLAKADYVWIKENYTKYVKQKLPNLKNSELVWSMELYWRLAEHKNKWSHERLKLYMAQYYQRKYGIKPKYIIH